MATNAPKSTNPDEEKVGSSRAAAQEVGGKLDFGNPVHQPEVVRMNEDDPIDRPAGSALGVGSDPGRRTVGVGSAGGADGDSSGGDIDPDFVGLAGGAGLTQSPGGRVTTGPSSTTGSSDEFAGGGHAKGDNALPKGQIGGETMKVRGTTDSPPDADTGREGASENQYDPQDTN
jgi:hypothetical protein